MTEDQLLFGADRLADLISEAHATLDEAIDREINWADRSLAGIVILFSGGNDSTTLAHLFKDRATHAAHANTGIGIEQTRQYVRDTCAEWHLPLIEEYPDFWATYQKAEESGRRKGLGARDPIERRGSTVWVSPLINWTKLDLNAYRELHPDVPRNEVSDLLHMSGECLCGAFAHEGELDEIAMWFPEVAAEIRVLEKEVATAGIAPPERCKWGWGAGKETPSRVGVMCSSCDARFEQLAIDGTDGAS